MLWQVDGSNLSLLGSVHSALKPLHIGAEARAALHQAETIAFETNVEVQVPMPSKFYPSADSLSANVSAKLYEGVRTLAERLDLDAEYLSTCRPWWAAIELMNRVLSERGYRPANGVDWQALAIANAGGKAKFFLESGTAGLMPFACAPHSEQEASLSQVAQHTDEGIQMVDSIVAAWESGTPANLEPIYRHALRQMPSAYALAFDGRNKQWIRHLLRLAASGRRVVAVVGVLHFAGPSSIQNLLSKAAKPCSFIA